MKVESEKVGLKLNIQKTKIMASNPITSWHKSYSFALKTNRVFQSMSRKGNCHDNAVMENFFGIMKQEMYYGAIYRNFDELKSAIDQYIKYYNELRIKAGLGYLSPVDYRLSKQSTIK